MFRVFSYLPNPRLAKAAIAARINGVEFEMRGAKPSELPDWMWDFDAHELTAAEREDQSTLRTAKKGFSGGIHKTDAFLAAHPFGNVPAGFGGDGMIGIFESNSIARAVARLGQDQVPLYGSDELTASRIDSFLDASLTFGVESQRYLFALGGKGEKPGAFEQMKGAFTTYMGGINTALTYSRFVACEDLSLADIAFACELVLFALERHESSRLEEIGGEPLFNESVSKEWPRAHAHFFALLEHPAFAPDLKPYFEEMTFAKLFG
ncbi:MAG: glutathione S-transferase family protein [Pseudomonadota bacterium]